MQRDIHACNGEAQAQSELMLLPKVHREAFIIGFWIPRQILRG
jgi:hypothetical protein